LVKQGKSPCIALKNRFNATLGASDKLSRNDSFGACCHSPRADRHGRGQSELAGCWIHMFNDGLRPHTQGRGGFANNNPDVGVGVTLICAF
jgi:hypothetical protein